MDTSKKVKSKKPLPLCPFHCKGCKRKAETRYFSNSGPLKFYVHGVGPKDVAYISPFFTCPETYLYKTQYEAEKEWIKAVTGK